LIRHYDLGVTVAAVSPRGIADAVNRLDPAIIDHYKMNSLAAARELCWEREAGRLIEAYAAVLQEAAA
jgi:hypothetical protein